MLVPKKEFVDDFVRGYMDGHKEELEKMEPEEMERKIIKAEGFAEGFYDILRGRNENRD